MSYIVCGISDYVDPYTMPASYPCYPEECYGVFENYEEAEKTFRSKVTEIYREQISLGPFDCCDNFDEVCDIEEEKLFESNAETDANKAVPSVCWLYNDIAWSSDIVDMWNLFYFPWDDMEVKRFPYVYIRKISSRND